VNNKISGVSARESNELRQARALPGESRPEWRVSVRWWIGGSD
jgi:hypothetical protein